MFCPRGGCKCCWIRSGQRRLFGAHRGQLYQRKGSPIRHYWLQFHAAEEQVPETVLASPGQMTLVTVSPPTLAQCPV